MPWCTVCRIFKSSQCMKIFCIPLFLTITIAAVIMHFALLHGSNVGKLSTHRIPMHSYFIFKDRLLYLYLILFIFFSPLGRLDLYTNSSLDIQKTHISPKTIRKLNKTEYSGSWRINLWAFQRCFQPIGSETQSSVAKVFSNQKNLRSLCLILWNQAPQTVRTNIGKIGKLFKVFDFLKSDASLCVIDCEMITRPNNINIKNINNTHLNIKTKGQKPKANK